MPLKVVDKYKYIGIVLDESFNYDVTGNVLASAGNRVVCVITQI